MDNSGLIRRLSSDKQELITLCLYVFGLLFLCSKMSPLFFTNEWPDVNTYFNVGKSIFNGRTLYTEAFDHKGPLIFFVYGLGYLISNDSFLGVFIFEYISWVIMIFAVYFTAKLYLNKVYSLVVALIFPLFLFRYMKTGGSPEEFILMFECVSLYLFVKYFKMEDKGNHKPLYMFVHGVMFAATFLTKLNLVIFWVFPLAAIFINLLINKNFRNLLLNILAFIGGVVLVSLPIIVYFGANGALSEAYSVYIELNGKYARIDSMGTVAKLIFRRTYSFLRGDSIVWVMLMTGIFVFPWKILNSKIEKISFYLSGIGLYIVVLMSKSYHIYYPIPLIVFTTLGLITVLLFAGQYLQVHNLRLRFIVLIAVIAFLSAISQKGLSDTKADILLMNRFLGDNRQRTPLEPLVEIIKKEQSPTLLYPGNGLGNNLFTVCNIVPNIRYFVSPNLKSDIYPQMESEQRRYIENKEVMFIVLSQIIGERNMYKDLPALERNYTLIKSDTVSEYRERDYPLPDVYDLYKRKP